MVRTWGEGGFYGGGMQDFFVLRKRQFYASSGVDRLDTLTSSWWFRLGFYQARGLLGAGSGICLPLLGVVSSGPPFLCYEGCLLGCL